MITVLRRSKRVEDFVFLVETDGALLGGNDRLNPSIVWHCARPAEWLSLRSDEDRLQVFSFYRAQVCSS